MDFVSDHLLLWVFTLLVSVGTVMIVVGMLVRKRMSKAREQMQIPLSERLGKPLDVSGVMKEPNLAVLLTLVVTSITALGSAILLILGAIMKAIGNG